MQKKKACIVTVYDTVNPGSYWQGYALGKIISEMGFEVYYLQGAQTRNILNSIRYRWRGVGGFLKGDVWRSVLHLRSMRQYGKIREYRIIQEQPDALNAMDFFVLGSDTIWNLADAFFLDCYRTFWGATLPDKPIITYAASISDTPVQQVTKMPELPALVARWHAISVRDHNTHDAISAMTDKPVQLTCDPTLFLPKETYMALAGVDGTITKTIFLYLFEPLAPDQQRALRAFALRQGLQIIQSSVGKKPYMGDRLVMNAPYTFIQSVCGAAYVVTDTFHGTVFSINMEKRFAVIDRGKNKVNDFIEHMGYADRLVPPGGDLITVLEKEILYAQRRERLDAFRTSSRAWLRQALEG